MQQQEDELRLRGHEQALKNETKNEKAEEDQRLLEIELTKGSSRASGWQADDLESVGWRRKLERTVGWQF